MKLNGPVPGPRCRAWSDSLHGCRVIHQTSPADWPGSPSDQPCPALPLLWYTAGHCRRALDCGNYYCYYYFYYYHYYNYYYYYCYYYYCRDPMSFTRNPTVLYGVQVLQIIVYYTYIGIVFNNFGTVAKTMCFLYHLPVVEYTSLDYIANSLYITTVSLITPHHTKLYCTILHITVQHCTVLDYTSLQSTSLHYTTLY